MQPFLIIAVLGFGFQNCSSGGAGNGLAIDSSVAPLPDPGMPGGFGNPVGGSCTTGLSLNNLQGTWAAACEPINPASGYSYEQIILQFSGSNFQQISIYSNTPGCPQYASVEQTISGTVNFGSCITNDTNQAVFISDSGTSYELIEVTGRTMYLGQGSQGVSGFPSQVNTQVPFVLQ